MLRNLTPDMLAAIQAKVVRLRFFYEGFYRTGVVRYWSGVGPIQWDNKTWEGRGDLLSIGNVQETTDIKANGISISLAGVKQSGVGLVLTEGQRSKTGRIWLALMNDDAAGIQSILGPNDDEAVGPNSSEVVGEAFNLSRIITQPMTIFYGRLDGLDLQDGQETATVTATYVHHLQTFETPKMIRYTDQEQKRLYPGDRGLEYISWLQDAEFPWGGR